jgi:CRP/FNR family transcriptional regulator, cyclic AMP receptor protein
LSIMEAEARKKDSICRYVAAEDLKSVFRFLAEEEIENLCPYLEIRNLASGTTLMVEGEPGDFMGFLVKGRLAAQKETPFPGKYILLAILDPGAIVGEIAVMEHGCLRNVTITSMEESQLLILARQGMDELIQTNPVLGNKILKRIIQVLSRRLQRVDDRLTRLL